jgi:hypothetical protein
MAGDRLAYEFVQAYQAYLSLLDAVGHEVDQAQLVEYLASSEGDKSAIRALVEGGGDPPEAHTHLGSTPVQTMHQLLGSLAEELGVAAPGQEAPLAEVPGLLASLAEQERDALADAVTLNGHRRFILPRYTSTADVRSLLEERQQQGPVALSALSAYLSDELGKRGFTFSQHEVRHLLVAPDAGDRVPYCLKGLLQGINGEFRARLVPLTDLVGGADPDAWLEEARSRLRFRSHSAMHKAIAQATELKYDCVHKALSGAKKARRIQVEIKYCLERWLRSLAEGMEPSIDDQHRAVPVEDMCCLLPHLEARYGTKERVYQEIAARTGAKAGSVRRYFRPGGQLKCAPLAVYRCACRLATDARGDAALGSYLADDRTRRAAYGLARRLEVALRDWRSEDGAPEREVEFRQLRHELIATIKEGRHRTAAVVDLV